MRIFAEATMFCTLLLPLPLVAQNEAAKGAEAEKAAPASHPTATPVKASAPVQESGHGQEVYDQNCSRCHNAPEGFSSHISATVAMHMRSRASLSQADYLALLQFLNP